MLKPSEHLHRDFEPNYQEYLADPTTEWKAKNAAQAANNHLEWTFKYYKQTNPSRLPGNQGLGDFRNDIYHQCPDAGMMRDLAEAAKHRFLARSGAITTSSTSAHVSSNSDLLVVDYKNRSFTTAINEVFKFWQNWPD